MGAVCAWWREYMAWVVSFNWETSGSDLTCGAGGIRRWVGAVCCLWEVVGDISGGS